MRVTKNKTSEAMEADMTPMIDIVFQLIAFFMVLVNFTKVDQDSRIKLPSSVLAKPPAVKLEDPMTLQITEKGTVLVGGQLVKIEKEELDMFLERERRSIGRNKTNNKPEDVPVIIRAHMDAPIGDVQQVIQACQDKHFVKFRLRVKEDDKTSGFKPPGAS